MKNLPSVYDCISELSCGNLKRNKENKKMYIKQIFLENSISTLIPLSDTLQYLSVKKSVLKCEFFCQVAL